MLFNSIDRVCVPFRSLGALILSLNLLWRSETLLLKVVRIFGNLADEEVDDDDDR